jgi:hypothetical protein
MRRLLPVAAGPLAFALDFQLRYALVPWACRTGLRWTLTWVSVPLLLAALIGFGLDWAAARRPGGGAQFINILGMILNAVFALSIVAITLPDFYFHPCQ